VPICHICGNEFEIEHVTFDKPLILTKPPKRTFTGYSKQYLINDDNGQPQETCKNCAKSL